MISPIRKEKLLVDYDRMVRAVRMRLLDHYNSKLVWGTFAEARQRFAALISQIPDIGQRNVWQFNLDTSAMALALYSTLKAWGFTLPEAAQITRDSFEAYLQSFPRLLRLAYRWYYFSPLYQHRLRQGAVESQLRRYPGDWVFTYIERNDNAFDAGIDITECAIIKFYQAHKAAEFVPYLCELDHAMGKLFGLGLTRQGTLAEGASLCDCRWKRGAETSDWTPMPIPDLRIFDRKASL